MEGPGRGRGCICRSSALVVVDWEEIFDLVRTQIVGVRDVDQTYHCRSLPNLDFLHLIYADQGSHDHFSTTPRFRFSHVSKISPFPAASALRNSVLGSIDSYSYNLGKVEKVDVKVHARVHELTHSPARRAEKKALRKKSRAR